MKFILFMLFQCSALFLERRQILKTVPLLAVQNHDEKFCKDCKFFKKDFFTETKYGHCTHFPFEPTSNYLVDGYKDDSPASYYFCSTARSSDRMCGPEGKYFSSRG